ncbi:MAG: 5'-nucleotidase, lipoprotein e(P4) family [Halioglobus sp.]|nr:5'-nucleotidase, lipoprotein e(P4) family [Halioglobus sp.]
MRVRLIRAAGLAALLTSLSACNSPSHPSIHESLNATLWTMTAPEYFASASQAYRAARDNLVVALNDPQWSAAIEQTGDYAALPPAVLMDIDQTILDTSIYNARIVTEHGEYTQKTFSDWCHEATAPAIPGAKNFIQDALSRGVKIIYYSRRIESLRECTTKNLQALGLPVEQEFLLLNNYQPETEKAYLRAQLSDTFRILLLVGDDLDDFVANSKTDPVSRMALVRQYHEHWGRKWVVLPNPMYGAWDTSLYGHDYGMPRHQRVDAKVQYLSNQ